MKYLARKFLVALLASLFCSASIPQARAAEPELHVIPLKHRFAEDVIPLLRPLLAPGESVSGVDSHLIVRATPRTIAQIERMLADVDTPRRNLRISVRHAGESERLQARQGVSGDAHQGNTRIVVTGGARNTGGVNVGHAGPAGALQLHSEQRVTTKRDTSTQDLTVLDGGRAFLRVGESIPLVQPFLALAGNRVTVLPGIQYYDVTTGFEVEPRILGERILLTVTPRIGFRSNQGTQNISLQELHTAVAVQPGEWVDLGGAVESSSEVSRQILSTRRNTSGEDSRFLIRVDLQ